MKKKLIRRILAVAVIATFLIGTFSNSNAQEYDAEIPTEEMEVIDAASIGIKTMDTEVLEDEIIVPEAENPIMDEDVHKEKSVKEETVYAEADQEEAVPVEEDVIPEGMYEGYEEGVYLPINSACELHAAGCYKCEECTWQRTLSYDEEREQYIGEEYCIVCGHGTCIEIAEDAIEDYAPVEESECEEES